VKREKSGRRESLLSVWLLGFFLLKVLEDFGVENYARVFV